MKRSAVVALAVLAAALLVAGCGESSSENAERNALPPHNQGFEGDGGSKATAPDAPAGSEVVPCSEGRIETRQLRATEVDCDRARKTMRRWQSSHACTLGNGSRSSCSVDSFRCQAVRAGSNASVSCAGPQGDVSFIAKS
jgi:hypothetical protein